MIVALGIGDSTNGCTLKDNIYTRQWQISTCFNDSASDFTGRAAGGGGVEITYPTKAKHEKDESQSKMLIASRWNPHYLTSSMRRVKSTDDSDSRV